VFWLFAAACAATSVGTPLIAIVGTLLLSAAGGALDSTVKALVADLVPASRPTTA